jgi:hypothetical protein
MTDLKDTWIKYHGKCCLIIADDNKDLTLNYEDGTTEIVPKPKEYK